MVAGLRPGTPDNAPIVGRGDVEGLVSPPDTSATASCSRPLQPQAVVATSFMGEAASDELTFADPARFAKGDDVNDAS